VATTTSPEPDPGPLPTRSLITESAEETEQAGKRLGPRLRPGDLLLLVGELGSGKTTLVRGLAQGMGVKGDVMSPTFQLVRVYPGPVPLAHVDLYRLNDPTELGDLGLDELLDEGVVVVEWGDRLGGQDEAKVLIEDLGFNRRRLSLEGAPRAWSW
jgi:tRNA threonylcarbamoyladenosine biosynthesis protein TsaE